MGVSLKNVNNSFHKLLFCSVSAACLASIPVAPAYSASNTYLLQLGSFDTKEQAMQKWQELKEKNPDILGSINPHITEVAMGDNDKVNYRTEAGPLDSRETATKLCTELQAKGADCAVVETAMFTDDAPAAEAPAQVAEAPAATPAKEEAKKEEPAAAPAPATAEEHPAHEAAVAAEPVPTPAPAEAPATPPAHSSANAAEAPTPTQSVAYVPGREPKFLDEGNPVSVSTAQPAATSAVAEEKPTATSAPQDLAAAEPQHADKVIPERAPRFLDDTPAASAPASQPQSQPEVQTAAAEPAAEPVPAKATDSDDDDDESPAESRRPTLYGHKHRAGHEVATTHAAHVETATVANEQPAASSPSKPGFFARLFGSSETPKEAPKTPEMAAATPPVPEAAPAPAAMPAPSAHDVEGNVSVAEAIRVPLTDENPRPKTALPAPEKSSRPALTTGGNYWAQINYFTNEAKAHEFYEQFRSIYPEISDGIRMSISRPYAYANASGHVTLRIGSFATLNDIGVICSIAVQHNLHCVSIYEGQNVAPEDTTASSANRPHAHVLNEITVDKSVPASDSGLFHTVDNPVFWVQLGSYDSPDDAWDKWRDIQKHHKKVVGRTSADVSQPESSAAVHKLFRLRAGPFSTQASADFLCGKLSKSGEDCLVVSER